ncbi:MAG: hypothetical protein ABIJ45_13310 [Candidatus Zixiibacteriota bacterium]
MKFHDYRINVMILFVTIIFLLASASLMANDKFPKEKSWSLQFEIDDDFQPSSFKGSMLSIKHHSSAKSAWRLGIKMDFDLTKGDSETESISPTSDITRDYDTENNRFNIDLVYQYMKYVNPKSDFNLFFAYGPHLGCYLRSDNQEETIPYGDEIRIRYIDYDYRTITVGTELSLGVEWFFMKNASLLAEYGAQINYSWLENKRTAHYITGDDIDSQISEDNRNSFTLIGNPVKFGLSIYF